MSETCDVAIIGAGAAGLFCAAEAARRGKRVILIEHTRKPGEKIRISGGGRCNFTNLYCAPDRFISANPHFCKSALSRYDQYDFIALVDAHNIAWYEKTLGQLFCEGRSTEIVDMLLSEMRNAGATLKLSTEVQAVDRRDGGFRLRTGEALIDAEKLVIATGGKSIPKMGATDFGHRIARQFGINVIETRAGLVPFTLSPEQKEAFGALSGVSVDTEITAGGARFAEAMLFTHRGLSGPAVLQASSYWRPGEDIAVAFGDRDAFFERLKEMRSENGRQAPSTALASLLPTALARVLADEMELSGNLADLSDTRLQETASLLAEWRIRPVATEGYRTAEVTLGGVDTDALDSRTMEARANPGLYFIGEVVDVTGWLGGYNFQWAWSSGWAAGQAV